jgi:hypothetical protein
MNARDMARLGIEEGQLVSASTWGDSGLRRVGGLVALAHDIPEGCAAGFYPECNALIPVWHHGRARRCARREVHLHTRDA